MEFKTEFDIDDKFYYYGRDRRVSSDVVTQVTVGHEYTQRNLIDRCLSRGEYPYVRYVGEADAVGNPSTYKVENIYRTAEECRLALIEEIAGETRKE